jgi:hypothetical protein
MRTTRTKENQVSDQPQRAVGRACVERVDSGDRLVVTVTVSDGREVGFAIGAVRAAGFAIRAARPAVLTLAPIEHKQLTALTEALVAAGFRVDEVAE